MSNQPHRPRTSPAPESSKTPDRVDFVFRVFISGKLHAEVRVQVEEEVKPTFEALAQEVIALGAADDHMIEVEDLTEPEPEQRFFRFGTSAKRMVRPVAINLAEFLKESN